MNYLSRWKERTCHVNAMIEEGEEIEKYQWTTTCEKEIQFGQQLSEDKKEEICLLLLRFHQVTKDTPG